MSDYHIDANDLAVLSGIYQQTRANFGLYFSIREILGFLPQPLSGMKIEFEYMQSLLDRGILSFSYPPEHDFHTNLSTVVQGQYRLYSLIWSILLGKIPAPREIRLQRVLQRNAGKPEEIQARMDAQMDDAEKIPLCDLVVQNSGSLEDLRHAADALIDSFPNIKAREKRAFYP